MWNSFVDSLWFVFTESGLWLLVGFLIAGAVHAFVPARLLLDQLGRPGLGSIAKAAAFGLPLPLCSCSVIPVAAGLRQGGAGKGASAAFTISTPQTGEESIPITWALFGPVFALTRPVVAVVTAFAAGVLIDRFAGDDHDSGAAGDGGDSHAGNYCHNKPEPGPSCCSSDQPEAPEQDSAGCCSHEREQTGTTSRSVGSRLVEMLRYALVTLPVDLAPWLAMGLVGAALIGAFVPADWVAEFASNQFLQMGAMLVLGVPLYICATSSTPLAFGLVAAGLSPGAALVLLLVGPATNVATILWVLKDLGARALAIYLSVIAATAIAAGVLFNALLGGLVDVAEEGFHGAHEAGTLAGVFAVGLAALLLFALFIRFVAPRFAIRRQPELAGADG